MFNPSTGGQDRNTNGERWRYKADPTINQILQAVDEGTFGFDVKGVHIRNLFTYRTSKPDDLIEEFDDEIERIRQESEQENPNLENEILIHLACEQFGCVLDVTGGPPDDWVTIAEFCKYVVVAWGDCGGNYFQGIKDEV